MGYWLRIALDEISPCSTNCASVALSVTCVQILIPNILSAAQILPIMTFAYFANFGITAIGSLPYFHSFSLKLRSKDIVIPLFEATIKASSHIEATLAFNAGDIAVK